MFTINFVLNADVAREGKEIGSYYYGKQVKFPYVSRIGETVRFGLPDEPEEDREVYIVEDVILDTVSREFIVVLQTFVYDVADINVGIDRLEKIGFSLISYDGEDEIDPIKLQPLGETQTKDDLDVV